MEEDCLFYVIEEDVRPNTLFNIASKFRSAACMESDDESLVRSGYYGEEVRDALDKYSSLLKKAKENSFNKIYKFVQNL